MNIRTNKIQIMEMLSDIFQEEIIQVVKPTAAEDKIYYDYKLEERLVCRVTYLGQKIKIKLLRRKDNNLAMLSFFNGSFYEDLDADFESSFNGYQKNQTYSEYQKFEFLYSIINQFKLQKKVKNYSKHLKQYKLEVEKAWSFAKEEKVIKDEI